MKTLITLCTYNEHENLTELIPELLTVAESADLLVVDDNSPDGTGDLVQSLASQNPRVHLLRRPGKQGLGTATMAAFQYGLQHEYDLLLNMDADFSHPPDVVPRLLQAADSADIAIASRYVEGGGVLGWTFGRRMMSRLINIWARTLLGLSVGDTSGSFRCYRTSLLRQVDWSRAVSKGYGIQEEILYRCRKAGGSMQEVPFFFDDRRHGVTKISLRESINAVRDILWVGFLRLFH